jgi:diguanylate cyclase (GGDEF)-like protein
MDMSSLMTRELSAGARLPDFVQQEKIRLVFKQLPTMQTTSLIVALVLCFSVRNLVSRQHILVWMLLILGVVGSRVVLYFNFRRLGVTPLAAQRWERAYMALALVSGIAWGLSAFIIFPAGSLGHIALLVLVIASLSAATTVSHSALKFGPAAWAGPALLCYAIRCFMEGSELEYTISLLIVVYLFTIIRYSFEHHGTIEEAISLRFDNLELLDELRMTNDTLRLLSTTDRLTGIANRHYFEEIMSKEWRRAIRENRPLSVILLDIDRFKAYNDNYGHQEGDDCIQKVAAAIAGALNRPGDLAARFGGDEMVVVLPDTDIHGATRVAEKIRTEVAALCLPHAHSDTAQVVTVSVGVSSTIPEPETAPSQLLKLADTALYAAKAQGRNRIEVG